MTTDDIIAAYPICRAFVENCGMKSSISLSSSLKSLQYNMTAQKMLKLHESDLSDVQDMNFSFL